MLSGATAIGRKAVGRRDVGQEPRADMPWALKLLSAAVLVALVASGISPYDRTTWLLEITPVLVVLPVLWLTGRRFPLTPLLYAGIAVQLVGLLIGAAYTFPRVPLGEWLREALELSRNPYDRLGHVVQGIVPALGAREYLLRRTPVRAGRLLAFLTACIVMTFSASYELVEWLAAITFGADADDFLGMQGDPWDAQADMACAFGGAIAMLVLLPRVHDAQIAALGKRQAGAMGHPGH